MSRACCDRFGEPAPGADATAFGVTDWLAFAASPTFAGMALLSGVFSGGAAAMVCSAELSPLDGMAMMYLLMGIFHAGPWIRLVRERTSVG